MLELWQAIKEKFQKREPYKFPAHIEAVQLNPALLMLHMDGTDRQNPDVNVSPGPKKMLI